MSTSSTPDGSNKAVQREKNTAIKITSDWGAHLAILPSKMFFFNWN